MAAITLSSPFLIALVLLLVPGRKGKMRSEKEVRHDDLSMEQAESLYRERLARNGFEIESSGNPGVLKASLRKWPATDPAPPSNQAVLVEMQFAPDSGGVSVKIAAWLADGVFFDTGEGRFLDDALESVVNPDPNQSPARPAPSHSFMATTSLVAALLSIAVMAAVLVRSDSKSVTLAAVIGGTGLACIASIFVGREALQQINRRPTEILGKRVVLAAFLIGACGAVACGVVLYLRFGTTLSQWFRQALLGR